MNTRESIELAGAIFACIGLVVGALALIVAYFAAIGAAIGAVAGAAVWVFRALTGW